MQTVGHMHEGGGGAVTSELGWVLIRQDEGGNRYRVGRYATRAEAERVAGTLVGPAARSGAAAGQSAEQTPEQAPERIYVIEPVSPRPADS
jgi:hypothetical protein